MTTLKMLGHNLLVELDETQTTTKQGILLPGSSKKNQAIGKVIAAGPGNLMKTGQIYPLSVHVGEDIIFDPECATELNKDICPDGKYYVVQCNMVIAVIERTFPEIRL